MKKFNLLILLTLFFTVTCSKQEKSLSADNQILEFLIEGKKAEINNNNISLSVPSGMDLNLAPTISISEKATITPNSGVVQDFTNQIKYTVFAENGDKREYLVTITNDKSDKCEILNFSFPSLGIHCTIDADTIKGFVPLTTNLKELIPEISVSERALINPNSGIVQDFGKVVKYTVTAESGKTKEYFVEILQDKSDECSILSFSFTSLVPEVKATINQSEIEATVPFGTDLSELIPSITISKFAKINPENGVKVDFTNPAIYQVTAQNNTIKQYTVNVKVLSFMTLIQSVDKEKVPLSGLITIIGNFANKDNIVKLGDYLLDIVSESSTQIVAKTPKSMPYGSYPLNVTSNQATNWFSKPINVFDDKLTILSIKRSDDCKRSEIVINGRNFDQNVKVYLISNRNSNTYFEATIISKNDNQIICKAPDNLIPVLNVKYYVELRQNGITLKYDTSIGIEDCQPTFSCSNKFKKITQGKQIEFSILGLHLDLKEYEVYFGNTKLAHSLEYTNYYELKFMLPAIRELGSYSIKVYEKGTNTLLHECPFTVVFDIEISSISKNEFTFNEPISIKGNFQPSGNKIDILLHDLSAGLYVKAKILSESKEEITFEIPLPDFGGERDVLADNQATIIVEAYGETKNMTVNFVKKRATIESMEVDGDKAILRGSFFYHGNKVVATNILGVEQKMKILSENENTIEFKLTDWFGPHNYFFTVETCYKMISNKYFYHF